MGFRAATNPNVGAPARPADPTYSAVYDPATMALLPGFEKEMERQGAGFTQARREALRTGPGAWANLARTQNAMEARNRRERAAQEAGSAGSEAMSELAMRGGLSSGARERLAGGAAANKLNMLQDISRGEQESNLKTSLADEESRARSLAALPGMEAARINAWEQVKGQDLGNLLKENESRNRFNMDRYNAQMSAWAAEQQARATERSGKGGGK